MLTHGICRCWIAEKKLHCVKEYDAFIAFCDQDEAFLVKNILFQLENGPKPYKLTFSRDLDTW